MKTFEIAYIDGHDMKYKTFITSATDKDTALENLRKKYTEGDFDHQIITITEKMWSDRQREFFFSIGCEIDENDVVKIPRRVWAKEIYRGVDANTGIHNWMINSVNGCCLIFEHKHFEIV